MKLQTDARAREIASNHGEPSGRARTGVKAGGMPPPGRRARTPWCA